MIEWQWTPRPQVSKGLVDLARRAASDAPANPQNWANLANLLTLLDGHRDALNALVEGVEQCPEDDNLRYLASKAHYALGEYETALESCDSALRLNPGHEGARLLRFNLLVKTGSVEAAGTLFDTAVEAEDSESYVFDYLCARLAEPGIAEELLELCNARLARTSPSVQAVYFKAVALAALGDAAAAEEVLSLDRVVTLSTPPAPAGYPDREAFRAALADEILRHPSLKANPRGKATSGGQQTDPLRERDGPALAALLDLVRAEVERYATLARPAANRTSKCALQVWAVVLGPDGHQQTHRHPDGWLSGVYYVQAPWSQRDGRYCGDLLIGGLGKHMAISAPWEIRRIEPVPGQLVLFPSYVPHETEPSNAAGQRISIAFDVLPIG